MESVSGRFKRAIVCQRLPPMTQKSKSIRKGRLLDDILLKLIYGLIYCRNRYCPRPETTFFNCHHHHPIVIEKSDFTHFFTPVVGTRPFGDKVSGNVRPLNEQTNLRNSFWWKRKSIFSVQFFETILRLNIRVSLQKLVLNKNDPSFWNIILRKDRRFWKAYILGCLWYLESGCRAFGVFV